MQKTPAAGAPVGPSKRAKKCPKLKELGGAFFFSLSFSLALSVHYDSLALSGAPFPWRQYHYFRLTRFTGECVRACGISFLLATLQRSFNLIFFRMIFLMRANEKFSSIVKTH